MPPSFKQQTSASNSRPFVFKTAPGPPASNAGQGCPDSREEQTAFRNSHLCPRPLPHTPTSPREVSGFTVTPPALREVRTFTGQWQPAKVEGGGQLCQTLPDVEGGVPGGQCRTAGPSSFSCHQTGAAFLAGWAAAGRAQVRPGSRGCRAVKKHSRAPGAVPSGGGLPPGGLHGAKSPYSCSSAHSPQGNLKSPLWSEVHGYNLSTMVLFKPKPCGFLTWKYQVLGPLSDERKTSPSTWTVAEQARSFREWPVPLDKHAASDWAPGLIVRPRSQQP